MYMRLGYRVFNFVIEITLCIRKVSHSKEQDNINRRLKSQKVSVMSHDEFKVLRIKSKSCQKRRLIL